MKTLKELLQKESPFLLIAGPCAIEGEEMAFKIAEKCIEIAKNKLKWIPKTGLSEGLDKTISFFKV